MRLCCFEPVTVNDAANHAGEVSANGETTVVTAGVAAMLRFGTLTLKNGSNSKEIP